MHLRPIFHVCCLGRIGFNPGLGKRIVKVRPLGYYVRFAVEYILLEPAFDIGRHELSGVGTASISHNRAERAANPVAQRIIGGSQG